MRYSNILRALSALALLVGATACQPTTLQTVETGEIFLPEQDPKYRFTRNQESSVNTQEPELTLSVLSELRTRYINEAYIRNNEQLAAAYALLDEGQYGYAPLPRIAASEIHNPEASQIVTDIKQLIRITAEISGMGAENPNQHRRREAAPGQSGYIATSASSKLSFVDARGLVIADALRGYLLGALALDQTLGVHLDDAVITSERLTAAQEAQILLEGNNYTELEHHWDRAYGYYLYGLRQLCVGNGIVALRGISRRLDLAFTLGRIDISYHLYDKLVEHTQTIRRELARVLLIRLEHLLLGGNTLANLREEPMFAFSMLSEGYGLIYALQFLRDTQGKPYFTLPEIKDLQQQLIGSKGFWEKERLLGQSLSDGALAGVMQSIRTRIKLD